MPANIAMEIARAPDGDVQRALAEAYESKLLPGNQILAIRRIIQQRNQRRKAVPRSDRGAPRSGKATAASLVKSYETEAQRQKLMVKKAELKPRDAGSYLGRGIDPGCCLRSAGCSTSGRRPLFAHC